MEPTPESSTSMDLLYSRLPLKPWQTRLLKLHQNTGTNLLSGELIVADITHLDGAVLHEDQEYTQYVALSYTWGNGPFSKKIVLNSVEIPIKENLYEFLLRFRRSSKDAFHQDFIWIDAVCINQADDHEKSNQVSTMMVFYQHAKQVIVWLGKGSDNTDAAMEFLEKDQTLPLDVAGRVARSEPHPSSTLETGLHELYSTPWATRIWIKQEVWSAKDITVLCGRCAISWDNFSATLESLKKAESVGDDGRLDDKSEALRQICTVSSKHHALMRLGRRPEEHVKLKETMVPRDASHSLGKRQDILHLLEDARYCESTDVRDRVFALLGMCNDRSIEVDYTANVTEVFTSLARHLIERERRVAVVLALSARFGSCDNLRLPSWVPDWRRLEVNTMGSVWQSAFELGTDYGKKHLALESILLLPPQCRGPSVMAWRKSHQFFNSDAPGVLRVRGFVLTILPNDFKSKQLESLGLTWNPLAEVSRLSPPPEDDNFQDWQRGLKSRALELLNSIPPQETPSFNTNSARDRSTPTNAQSRHMVIEALGFSAERYLPPHMSARRATLSDLENLGSATYRLGPARREPLEFQGGDVVTVIHGCYLPVVLRPVKKDGSAPFTFVGIVRCVAFDRLWERAGDSLDLFDEFRIVLHARAGLHVTETFEVV